MITAAMLVLRRWMIFAAGLAALFAPVAAQTPAATPHWQMDWGDRRCSLIRHPAARQPPLTLQTLPGSRIWQLLIGQSDWPEGLLRDQASLTFRLHPSGARIDSFFFSFGESDAGATLILHSPDPALVENFASAQRLTIEWRGETLAEVPLENARAAADAFRQCENQVMREWGIDPALYARLRSLPRFNMATVFSDRDYPTEALRERQSGESTVRVTIGPSGRVTGCALAVSSGHPVLDQRTCDVLRERVRTQPALDSNGVPTSVPLVTTIRWRLY